MKESRQAAIRWRRYELLRHYGRCHRRGARVPSLRDGIRDAKAGSLCMIRGDLAWLAGQGLIERGAAGEARSVTLTAQGWAALRWFYPTEFGQVDDAGNTVLLAPGVPEDGDLVTVPVIPARVAASFHRPALAQLTIRDAADYTWVSRQRSGPGELVAIGVSGSSMIDAGIPDGARIIIRRAVTADHGQIVAALLPDDTITLKRFERHGDAVRLVAANADVPPVEINAPDASFEDIEPIRVLEVFVMAQLDAPVIGRAFARQPVAIQAPSMTPFSADARCRRGLDVSSDVV